MAALAIQGTTSWAGKSLLTTALCRLPVAGYEIRHGRLRGAADAAEAHLPVDALLELALAPA